MTDLITTMATIQPHLRSLSCARHGFDHVCLPYYPVFAPNQLKMCLVEYVTYG